MKVDWSARADANANGIADFIAKDNPAAALETYFKIRDRASQLEARAELGRVGRTRFTRELVVVGTPYIIIYRIGRAGVTILRVIHGAQRWPPR